MIEYDISKGELMGFHTLDWITQNDELTFEFYVHFRQDVLDWINENGVQEYVEHQQSMSGSRIIDYAVISFPDREHALIFKLFFPKIKRVNNGED